MNSSVITCPATCELCGNWLPGHSTSCPRNGVHPSQWSLCIDQVIIQQEVFVAYNDINDDDTFLLFNDTVKMKQKDTPQIKELSF